MIDKIDGIKALQKTLKYIKSCEKESCINCEFAEKCCQIIKLAVDFSAFLNPENTIIFIP